MIEIKLYNSLTTVFPDREANGETLKKITACLNQPVSFQMAYKITDNSEKCTDFVMRIKSELDINIYYENYVSFLHTTSVQTDTTVGLFPDTLLPKSINPKLEALKSPWGDLIVEKGEDTLLTAYEDSWQAVWFCINEKGRKQQPGTHNIEIELYNGCEELVGSAMLQVDVLPAKLSPQKLIYTNWFHCDCLADIYNVEIFSDRFFCIMSDYVKKAVLNGMNMIMVPAFTPPLDTPIDGERMTAQLVKVKRTGDKYEFDFSLMKRFIDICRKCGIKYFEHSHFFTQWGATAAPKIVAEADGKTKKIFGWKTKATGKAYVSFLRQYIEELKKFLKEEKLEKRMLFHISDEPEKKDLETYRAARNTVIDMLDGYMVGDAMSNVEIYEQGLCQMPICIVDTIHDFIGKCKNLWAYYVGLSANNAASNRIFHIPRECNRMIGVQLYYYNIRGFLQWGYNYYYGTQSRYMFNPSINQTGSFHLPGTAYMVYPAFDGTAYQSIRQKIFAEGLNDIRLLTLLEKCCGREKCEDIINKHFGEPKFDKKPESSEKYMDFINEVYAVIKKTCTAER